MNDRRTPGPDDPANDRATPRELRGVARLLDERGARERGRLGGDALERIFAASDLQRPLGLEPVSPVIGRIVPARGFSRPYLRLAAAIAAVAGLGAVIAIALSLQGGGVPAGTELVEGSGGTPGVTPELPAPEFPAPESPGSQQPEPEAPAPKSMLASSIAVEHFDAALEGSIVAVTVSRPASAVLVALSDRSAGALAGFAGSDGGITDELDPLFSTGTLLDGADLTYDDLSDELASVVLRTSTQR